MTLTLWVPTPLPPGISLCLLISLSPEKPDIQFLEPLVSGHPTKLTCRLSLACDEPHPLLFSWVGDALDAMNPDTLHSSELTLTPRPQDHGTNLTCLVTLQGSQVALERTVQLNVSCECGGAAGSLRAVVCVWVCACVCVCREKASLLVYGPAPWELRWGVAVKDSSPIPGFPPGVLVSFHPTPPSAASPCLSAPDAPRNLRISLAFRNVTGRTGPLLSRAGSCSWDCLQDGAGEWA